MKESRKREMPKARKAVNESGIESRFCLLALFRVFGLSRFRDSARAIGLPIVLLLLEASLAAQQVKQLDPAGWGSDHVGKPVPAFTSGDECLFCHRMDVGPAWGANRHGQTVRSADPKANALEALAQMPEAKGLAAEVELLLGGRNQIRFLKRSTEHGRLDLLSVAWRPNKSGAEGKFTALENPHWDRHAFGSRCVGCHATGVDSARQTFAAVSHDCFVCHGEPSEKHTTEGRLVWLSPKRQDPAAVITSICAQCHLRTGTSRSTGLPYPNNFVAGDNLFRDFPVDLSAAALEKLNPGDRHVQQNVRDVVLLGQEKVTCLSCHNVHQQTTQKHHRVANNSICLTCHEAASKRERVPYEVHSAVCGY